MVNFEVKAELFVIPYKTNKKHWFGGSSYVLITYKHSIT